MKSTPAVQPELLHIFHEEGLELFPLSRSVYNHYSAEDGRTLFVLQVRCGKAKIGIEEFEDLFHPEPWFEVILHRPVEEASLPVGAVLTLPVGYDYEYDENITNFYYASHTSIEEIRLEVISWTDGRARMRLDGLTGGAHGDADTRIALEADFTRDKSMRRSIK
jgi:hypothetical protein